MNKEQIDEALSAYYKLYKEVRNWAINHPPIFKDDSWLSKRTWNLESIKIDDGETAIVKWSTYVGCGEYEHTTTKINLYSLEN